MVDDGPNYRELREMIYILREVGRKIKKDVEEMLDDNDDSAK
jgi:hypothetical protein